MSMAKRAKITHCVFDMDGLLLNTESFYTIVQTNLCRKYGKEFTWELKSKMMGMKALEAAQHLVDKLDIRDQVTPEEFLKQREDALDAMFPSAELMPGAERLLRHLKDTGVPFCLATSSHRRHVDVKTTNHKAIFSLFSHQVTGDQVKNGKPRPDIFLTAANRFSPPAEPAACLVFEDAPSGVAAGKGAAMSVVMVPDPNLDKALTKEADLVISSLEAFQPEQWGLLPFTDSKHLGE